MKIGIEASLACNHQPTGVHYYARSLLGALKQESDSASQLEIYLPPAGLEELQSSAHFRVHRRPEMNHRLRNPWLAARSWLDRVNFFLSLNHQTIPYARGPRLIMIYDTIFEEFPECYRPGIPQLLRTQVEANLARASAVTVCSEHTAAGLRRHFGTKLPIFNLGGAAREVFQPAPSPVENENAPPFFLAVGRLDRRKNIVRVIEAYRELIRQGFHCKLVIVGPSDSGTEEVHNFLHADQVAGEDIQWTGYISENELVNLYQTCCALVMPSLAEGFGLPLLEAMACGAATITSNRSSLQEIAQDYSLLVNPESTREIAEAMKSIVSNKNLSAKLRKAGLTRSKQLTWEKCARTLIDCLRNF